MSLDPRSSRFEADARPAASIEELAARVVGALDLNGQQVAMVEMMRFVTTLLV